LCDIKSSLYNDIGVIKCQYCDGKVDEERSKDFEDYNTPLKKE
jgi:hypothetical protein